MQEAIEPHDDGGAGEQEYEQLGQQLSRHSPHHGLPGQFQKLVCRAELDFRAQTVHRDHEDEDAQHTGNEDIGKVNAVIQPRVSHSVHINDDGLEVGHGLPFRSSFGVEHGACGSSRGQFRHHAHIAIEQ